MSAATRPASSFKDGGGAGGDGSPELEAGPAWEAGSCEGRNQSWVAVFFGEVCPRLAAGSCGLGGGGPLDTLGELDFGGVVGPASKRGGGGLAASKTEVMHLEALIGGLGPWACLSWSLVEAFEGAAAPSTCFDLGRALGVAPRR